MFTFGILVNHLFIQSNQKPSLSHHDGDKTLYIICLITTN